MPSSAGSGGRGERGRRGRGKGGPAGAGSTARRGARGTGGEASRGRGSGGNAGEGGRGAHRSGGGTDDAAGARGRRAAARQRARAGEVRITDDRDRPDGRLVTVGGIPASYVDLVDPTHLEFEYVRRIGDVLDLLAPPGAPVDAVHVGGGGFTLPRYLAATRPGSRQVAIELDGELVELARAHLGLRTSARLRVRVGDGRAELASLPADSADVVIGDAFTGASVPAHLATVEYLTDVRRVLRPAGTYVLNVIDRPPLAFARAEAATLLRVFKQVLLVAEPAVLRGRRRGNVVLAGSQAPLPVEGLSRLAAGGAFPERVLDRSEVRLFTGGAKPLRDDGPPSPSAPKAPTALTFGDAAELD